MKWHKWEIKGAPGRGLTRPSIKPTEAAPPLSRFQRMGQDAWGKRGAEAARISEDRGSSWDRSHIPRAFPRQAGPGPRLQDDRRCGESKGRVSGFLCAVERRRPGWAHPEGSAVGVRETAVEIRKTGDTRLAPVFCRFMVLFEGWNTYRSARPIPTPTRYFPPDP
jgi:hypothetical protein